MCVRRARKGIAGFITYLIMLPPEGDKIEAQLRLSEDGNDIRWFRRFGIMNAESLQTFSKYTYTEQAGPFRMVFRIEGRGSSLAHIQIRTKLFGIPVPRFFGPTVEGLMSAGPTDRSWSLSVNIRHVWFGWICRYEGVMFVS